MTCVGPCGRPYTADDAWAVLTLLMDGDRVELPLCPDCQRTCRWDSRDYLHAAELYLRERMRLLLAEAHAWTRDEARVLAALARERKGE